jgi:hypothetical protein
MDGESSGAGASDVLAKLMIRALKKPLRKP